MDIAEFLLARIAEDEQFAREARDENPTATWTADRRYDGVWTLDLRSTHPDADSYGEGLVNLPREMTKHIACWDPARVLAECEAKRQFLGAVAYLRQLPEGMVMPDRESAMGLERTIAAMAAVYADHPDFDPAWSVTAAV